MLDGSSRDVAASAHHPPKGVSGRGSERVDSPVSPNVRLGKKLRKDRDIAREWRAFDWRPCGGVLLQTRLPWRHSAMADVGLSETPQDSFSESPKSPESREGNSQSDTVCATESAIELSKLCRNPVTSPQASANLFITRARVK